MKVHEYDGAVERRTVTAMITSTSTLAKVAAVWTGKDFASPQANAVGRLCVDHFRAYGKAPGKEIEPLVRAWAAKQGESDAVALVSDFLEGLSGEYERLAEEINPQYAVDQAHRLFNKVRIERLRDELTSLLTSDKVEDAAVKVSRFARVEVAEEAGFDPFQDDAEIESTLDGADKSIVTYPGGLGEFFGDALHRDALIAFMGPEGSGKSWWLMDVAFRAMSQRRRVAHFVVGDMSKAQVKKRLLVRLHQVPLRPRDVRWPIKLEPPGVIEHDVQRHEVGLSRKHLRATKDKAKRLVKSIKSYFRLFIRSAGTMTVASIRERLRELEVREDWVPDVVVIDYADVLAPPPGFTGKDSVRDGINANWTQLRALSQDRHCLVVTATQSNRESYDAPYIKMKHTGEDKRKQGLITAGYGINVGDDDRGIGMMRLNCLKDRDNQIDPRRFCYCAGCLELGNPAVLSAFPKRRPVADQPSTNGRRRAAT